MRAIGKIIARIRAVDTEEGIKFTPEYGELTEERKEAIYKSQTNGDAHGWNLRTIEHRYFFVEKFHETDFKKITPRAPMGSRVFDLSQILGISEPDKMLNAEGLAEALKEKTWE